MTVHTVSEFITKTEIIFDDKNENIKYYNLLEERYYYSKPFVNTTFFFLKNLCRSIEYKLTYNLTFMQCQLDDNNVVRSVSVDSRQWQRCLTEGAATTSDCARHRQPSAEPREAMAAADSWL